MQIVFTTVVSPKLSEWSDNFIQIWQLIAEIQILLRDIFLHPSEHNLEYFHMKA